MNRKIALYSSLARPYKLYGNRYRRYPNVYLASTFPSINNSTTSSFHSASMFLLSLPSFLPFLPFSLSLSLSFPLETLDISLCLSALPRPSLQRIERAHASASLIKRVSIIHAFAKLPPLLQWLPNPVGRVCDRSIMPGASQPSYIYCFSKNN